MGSNITPLLLQITLNLLKNIDLKLQSSKAEERLSPLLWKNFAPEVWQKNNSHADTIPLPPTHDDGWIKNYPFIYMNERKPWVNNDVFCQSI